MKDIFNDSPEEKEFSGEDEAVQPLENGETFDDSDMKVADDDDMKLLDDDAEIISFDSAKMKSVEEDVVISPEEITTEASGETKNFEPVSQAVESDGSTKTFDTVDNIPKKPKFRKKPKDGENGPFFGSNEKTAKAAKATASGVAFVARKAVTYLFNILFTILLVGIITGAVVVVAFIAYIKNYVDPNYDGLDNLKFDSALSTTMYYVNENGEEVLLEDDTLVSSENRMWADYEDIPQYLIDAYVAVEDQRFFEHDGVDMTRTASAVYNFFIPTSSSYGGGSTITQQLIKNVSGENSATIQRKVQEIFRAFNVENKYTKEEILEMYLNTIYLSHNSYGVRVAADTYFGKSLDALTLEECAAIASIGKWPTHYDPISNPNNNLTRRNLVLKLMLEQGKITQEEFNAAYDKPLKLADGSEENYTENVHSYYIDAVMDDVVADLMEEYGYDEATASRVLYSGGLKIITCLDPEIQAIAERVYTDSSYWPDTSGMQAQSAICIMDPDNGDILAMVGGLGEKRESRGFNRATQAFRQCGSSIKPLSIYAYGLDNGYYPTGAGVDDVPPVYYPETGSHWPKAGTYRGMVSLRHAIQVSLNTIPVRGCIDMGVEEVYENFADYGYTTLVESKTLADGRVVSDKNTSSMALGGMTYGVYIRDHTQAYATLANEGKTSESRTYSEVRDSSDKVLLKNTPQHQPKYKESTAYIITDLLMSVVGGNGTASNYVDLDNKFDMEVAGKTGTTNDKKDVWFSGYTPDLVACVWYGYDNNKVITSSGNGAAKLWNTVFNEIYSYYDANGISYKKQFDVPGTVVTDIEYCALSGKRATEACRNDLLHKITKSSRDNCVLTGCFTIYDKPQDDEFCDVHVGVMWDTTTESVCINNDYLIEYRNNNIHLPEFASMSEAERNATIFPENYCACPTGNLEYVGLRKIGLNQRKLEANVYVLDAECIYMDIPTGYILPADKNDPYYQRLLDEDGSEYHFGKISGAAANRPCTSHPVTYVPDIPTDPTDPSLPTDPTNPNDPALPPTDPETPIE